MSNLSRGFLPQHIGRSGLPSDTLMIAIELAANVGCTLCIFYLTGHAIGNTQVVRDSVLLAILMSLVHWSLICRIVFESLPTSTYLYLIGTLFVQFGAATWQSHSKKWRKHEASPSKSAFLKPLIFPCRTTHTRLFPSKHSFSYSYLLVGVPVDWEGASGSLLSAGDTFSKGTWFSVHATDYLARGTYTSGLQGKLKEYLSTQGISETKFSHAYLVTAPRFLGFSFNPVSFWYLYDHARTLSAMILEVNNTFDERRMYFMESTHSVSPPLAGVFSNSWAKDFHVSPFNDRNGSYTVTAKDFMFHESAGKIDNNIVLKEDEGKAKIIARVFSTEPGIDPSSLSSFEIWSFLARWWWTGFATNPRILKEARVLWAKNLQVYYRPEVFRTSVGRNETSDESIVEPYFRAFLQDLVDNQEGQIQISYRPAAGPERGSALSLCKQGSSGGNERCASASQSIKINVLTPAFYAEVVRFGSVAEAVAKVCFESTDRGTMVHISSQAIFQGLLQGSMQKLEILSPTASQRMVSCLRNGNFRLLFDTMTRPMLGRKATNLDGSDFDFWVSITLSDEQHTVYLHTARRMLLAGRIAFGFDWLLNTYGYFLCLVCLVQISQLKLMLGPDSLGFEHFLRRCEETNWFKDLVHDPPVGEHPPVFRASDCESA